jgi:hypothetical protein
MKTCAKCKKELDENCFYKSKNKLRYSCKECNKKQNQKYYKKHNQERLLLANNYNKEHRKEKLEYSKQYYRKNREKRKKYNKQYHKKFRKQIRLYEINYMKNNINVKIKNLISNRIRDSLRKNYKSAHTLDLIGCSIQNLKYYLQWTAIQNGYLDFDINNYSGREYHIDHIVPCNIFNLKDPNQQKECFNWRNMQILKAEENISKNDKIIY